MFLQPLKLTAKQNLLGLLQPQLLCAFSSRNGTSIHMATGAKNPEVTPDSGLDPLPPHHPFPWSALFLMSHGPHPHSASPCSLPGILPFHPFPHISRLPLLHTKTGALQVTLSLKILSWNP